jgi:hypothetical protein
VTIGTTPLHRDDLTPGEATYLVLLEGYLPRELKASLDPRQPFKEEISLSPVAPLYAGTIHGYSYNVPLTITLASDLKSGTMTQTSRSGDTVVKFASVWDGTSLRAITNEMISKPANVKWAPEAFSLHFSDDAKSVTYQCEAEGKTYVAELSAYSGSLAKVSSIYKGTIDKYSGSPRSLTISLAADRKSGTMTQGIKSGDLVVKFNGVWDGTTLRAVTDEVISKPKNVTWDPESFTLRFSDDGRSGAYECTAGGHTYAAQLSPP